MCGCENHIDQGKLDEIKSKCCELTAVKIIIQHVLNVLLRESRQEKNGEGFVKPSRRVRRYG